MSPSPLTRRQFLGTSIKVGAGAAALGLSGVGAPVGASAQGSASRRTTPAPPSVQRFVSRPDLLPPGVHIETSVDLARLPGQPSHIFVAPILTPGSSQPSSSQGLMIMDLGGNLVWWRQLSSLDAEPFDFKVQTYQGRPVLTWFQGRLGAGAGVHGTCVISDGSYTEIAGLHAVNYATDLHEFLLTPQGTAYITAYQTSGNLVIGHVQEVDIANNDLVWYWQSYPEVSPSESYTGTTGDYFHLNSVDQWPGKDRDVLVSARSTSAVYLVSRATKQIIWRAGGKASSFAMGPGTRFEFQHEARALADGSGISLFDDASQPSPEKQSWGKVINLDVRTRKATLRHQYNHTTSPIDTPYGGGFQLLPTGGHLVAWGADPYFSEFAASGAQVTAPLVLDGRLPAGIDTYRAYMYNWTGQPAETELVLAVQPGPGAGHFFAYASWNGATNVAYYEISAGRDSLKPRTVVAKRGFETAIPVYAPRATDFQVAALDARRRVLGRSAVTVLQQ